MSRHTLTSVLAAATFTIACGGSPETATDDTVAPAVANQQAQSPAAPPGTPAGDQEPTPAQSSVADGPDSLPDTASPLPLLGLGGVLALAGAAGIRALRRR